VFNLATLARKLSWTGMGDFVRKYRARSGICWTSLVDMYNKAGVVAKSLIELPVSDDQIARINEGTRL